MTITGDQRVALMEQARWIAEHTDRTVTPAPRALVPVDQLLALLTALDEAEHEQTLLALRLNAVRERAEDAESTARDARFERDAARLHTVQGAR